MPLFRYRAVDQFGEPLEGTMEEGSAARVTTILRERGAQVNEVLEIGGRTKLFGGPRRLGWSEIALLNGQLLAIVRGKIPVAPSVQAMAKDLENRRLKPVLEQLRSDLEAGRSLEEAFQRSPRQFPPIYLSLIRAGERSGNLTAVLEMISGYSTRILDLRERVFLALIYPAFVVGTILLAMINIFFEIIPVVGRTYRTVSLARFSKALGLMLEARVPMTEALDLAGAAAANEYLRSRVRAAAVHVAQGDRLADALSDTRYFPHSYLWFLANGESRGELPATLIELSETSEREVSVRDEILTRLVTPVTIITLGGFVAFVVVSMYLPIFSLGDVLTGP